MHGTVHFAWCGHGVAMVWPYIQLDIRYADDAERMYRGWCYGASASCGVLKCGAYHGSGSGCAHMCPVGGACAQREGSSHILVSMDDGVYR